MDNKITQLVTWIHRHESTEAQALLKAQGTTLGYAKQVAYGYKLPSGEKSAAIERATGVSRRYLRPDDWFLVWPELAASEQASGEQVSA